MPDLDPRRRVVQSVPRWQLPDDGAERARTVLGSLVVPRGRGARAPLGLLDWQVESVVEPVFGARDPQVVVAVPRGSGKSTLGSGCAVHAATYDRVPDAVVPLVGVNEEGARRLLWIARRFVEQDERLAKRARVYADRIRFPCWSSEIVALPAEPNGLLGLDFSLAVLDEIGAMPREVWDAVLTAQGKREGATVLGIGSPVPGASDLLRELLTTDGVRSTHYHAPAGCDVNDREAWRAANPSYGVLVTEDTMANLAATTPEPVFRSYRLGQFTEMGGAWLPISKWNDLADATRIVADGEDIALAFDGSFARDATVLIGCTRDGHVFVVDVWEAPKGDTTWRVPRRDVHAAVAAAFDRWNVRQMSCDPFIWRDAIEEWAEKYGADIVVEWATNSHARMAKASERFVGAVMDGSLSHDGSDALARHVANAHVKVTRSGPVPVKDGPNSPRRIDAAVAAVVAFDTAAQLPEPRRKRFHAY